MPDNLSNLRVLVTRPAHQAENLIRLLGQEGAISIPLPLLQISAVDEKHHGFHTIKQHIMDLDLFQHVIFISPNAANFGGEWIDQYWPQLPYKVNWYAIGQKTAQALNNYGIDAYHSPLGYDSEALLACPDLQQISGERVLIIRGVGGRPALGDELSARGAEVVYAELYERHCPKYENADIVKSLSPAPDVILISSGEGLNNLNLLVQQAGLSIDSLKGCHIIVPSERVKDIAWNMGFKNITTATGPDDQAVLDTLKQ